MMIRDNTFVTEKNVTPSLFFAFDFSLVSTTTTRRFLKTLTIPLNPKLTHREDSGSGKTSVYTTYNK